jgi:hypothetical protein
MDSNLSVSTILSSLEAQIAHHREQEAVHAERETFHHARRAEHAAELERLVRHYEAFKASAEEVTALASRVPLAAPPPSDDLPPGRKVSINRLAAQVIEGKGPHEPFTPGQIADEVNRRFAPRLGWTVDVRQISVALRWLAANGRIVLTEQGRQHRQSKFARAWPLE